MTATVTLLMPVDDESERRRLQEYVFDALLAAGLEVLKVDVGPLTVADLAKPEPPDDRDFRREWGHRNSYW